MSEVATKVVVAVVAAFVAVDAILRSIAAPRTTASSARPRPRYVADATLGVAALSAQRRRRTLALLALLLLLLAVAAVVFLLTSGSSTSSAPLQALRPGSGGTTVTVERRNLEATVTVTGQLGYAPDQTVYDQLSGHVTGLPQVGQVIQAGQRLFSVGRTPVVLLYGTSPARRDLKPGDTDGHDIYELNANLAALGYDSDQLVVSNSWQPATTVGVKELQQALEEPATGSLSRGSVVFMAGPQVVRGILLRPHGATTTATTPSRATTATTPTTATTASAQPTASAASVRSGSSRERPRSRPHSDAATVTLTFTTTSATTTTPVTTAPQPAPTITTEVTVTATPPTTTAPPVASAGPPGAGTAPSGSGSTPTKTKTTPTKTKTTPPRTHTTPTTTSAQQQAEQQAAAEKAQQQAEQEAAAQRAEQQSTSSRSAPTTASATTSTTTSKTSKPTTKVTPVPLLSTAPAAPTVSLKLSADQRALAQVGRAVTVALPNHRTVTGKVIQVGQIIPLTPIPVTVQLSQPLASTTSSGVTVSFVTGQAKGALVVPLTALVTTPGNATAVVRADSVHTVLSVTTGLTAGGYVQISGPGIHPGLRIEARAHRNACPRHTQHQVRKPARHHRLTPWL